MRIAIVGEVVHEEVQALRARAEHELLVPEQLREFSGDVVLLCCNDVTPVLSEVSGITAGVVWLPAAEGVEHFLTLAPEDCKAIVQSVDSIVGLSRDAVTHLEDTVGVSAPIEMPLERALSFLRTRFVAGVGAGFGNILQSGPMIRSVSEFLDAPIDVYIESFSPQSVLLLGRSVWTNFVFFGGEWLASKKHRAHFHSFNAGPLVPRSHATRVYNQRDFFDMLDECQHVHETEFHYFGIEKVLPNFTYEKEETKRYFLSDFTERVSRKGVVGVCSGSKAGVWEKRGWDRFPEVVASLKERGYTVRSFGSENEFVEGSEDYTGTPIRQNLVDIAECEFFLATDGGIFHMAEALGVPTVVLFGPTGIIKNGPQSPYTRIAHSGLACSPCNFTVDFHRCDDNQCMKGLEPELVMNLFDDLANVVRSGAEDDSSQVLKVLQHEQDHQDLRWRPQFDQQYRDEGFSVHPDSEDFLFSALNGSIRLRLKDRAQELFERALTLYPSSSALQAKSGGLKDFAMYCRGRNAYDLQEPSPRGSEECALIDVYLTTSQRAYFLKESLPLVLLACEKSPYDHRITVLADGIDDETWEIVGRYRNQINVVTTHARQGLPFMFNLVHDLHQNLVARTERSPDFICYIQDDCILADPEHYFSEMVKASRAVPEAELGYVAGFYTPIHPGFELVKSDSTTLLLSDSIDGKNLMGRPELFQSVGKLTWYFPDGERRGNPGPTRGSHFDLWQWKESPTCTMKQNRINVIVPGLIHTVSTTAQTSTWGNESDSDRVIQMRIKEGRVYKTRAEAPELSEADFYRTVPEAKRVENF